MMPRWADVTARMTNIGLSPTGKRVVMEARGEIFTVPAEKGDVRNLTHSSGSAERQPAWSPDGKYVSYFSDRSGEYQLVIEAQDGLTPPREVALEKPTFYYTPSWSPDSKKLLYTDTKLNVWVLDVETGKAKVVGRDPWMVPQRTLHPAWSPDSKWVAYASRLRSLYRAIFVSNVDTGETKQVTDGLADAMYPGVGRERQVPVVPGVHRLRPALAVARHDLLRPGGDVRAVRRGAEEGRAEPAAAGERRGQGDPGGPRSAFRRPRGAGGWRRAGGRRRRKAAGQAGDGPDRLRRAPGAHPLRFPASPSGSTRGWRRASAGTVFYLEAPGGGPARAAARCTAIA